MSLTKKANLLLLHRALLLKEATLTPAQVKQQQPVPAATMLRPDGQSRQTATSTELAFTPKNKRQFVAGTQGYGGGDAIRGMAADMRAPDPAPGTMSWQDASGNTWYEDASGRRTVTRPALPAKSIDVTGYQQDYKGIPTRQLPDGRVIADFRELPAQSLPAAKYLQERTEAGLGTSPFTAQGTPATAPTQTPAAPAPAQAPAAPVATQAPAAAPAALPAVPPIFTPSHDLQQRINALPTLGIIQPTQITPGGSAPAAVQVTAPAAVRTPTNATPAPINVDRFARHMTGGRTPGFVDKIFGTLFGNRPELSNFRTGNLYNQFQESRRLRGTTT